MTKTEATASIFVTAFQALTKQERRAVVKHMFSDDSIAHDLVDIAIIQQRRHEPSRSLESYVKERRVHR